MYYENEFELRYFEMDRYGVASPTAILTLLEEIAANHCLSISYGLFDLLNQNIGWVLLSGYMKMERYPDYKEKIIIRTWVSQYMGIRAIRENLIYDSNRNIIGLAKSKWVFFDIERRKPVYIFPEIQDKWKIMDDVCSFEDINRKIEPISSAKFRDEFTVTHFDLDTNEHLNNIRYLQWLNETIPQEIQKDYFLHSINGRFIGEAHYKDKIESLTEPGIENNSFTHTIRNLTTDKVCASAETIWKKRLK